MLRAYGEGNIFGEAYGEGPVRVLWLHGWARTGADFAASATELAREGIASVALDLPGFGSSPLPAAAGGGEAYARLLAPVVSSLGEGPLVLVGHSFGGRIAPFLAAEHPERVKALVLTGAPLVRLGSAHRSPPGYRVARALHRRGLLGEARMEAARQKYGSRDYREATGLLREIMVASVSEDYEHVLSLISVPVTLVWGADDHDISPEVARRIAQLLTRAPDVRLEVLADTGHLVPRERPAALSAHVRRLVQTP
ncbi:MAG: alpha/beta fold hydrolase [Acidobacteriota bacterium]|nr:alpha/beta fold hydrolase [Acidobacteriota bacterium]